MVSLFDEYLRPPSTTFSLGLNVLRQEGGQAVQTVIREFFPR